MTASVSTGPRQRATARGRLVLVGGLLVLAAALTAAATSGGVRRANRLTDVLAQTLEAEGIDAAAAQYRQLRDTGFAGVYESESDTNRLGYALLRKGRKESAIRVFQLNAEAHPASANVYDSLGEAYLAAGDKRLAIASYEKAVAVDPAMRSAVAALQTLANRPKEPYRPMVLFHISAGTLGILSGGLAMALRKGSRRHAVAGKLFVASMSSMSASGAVMAFVAPHREPINILMGILTFYLVATAWLTARRREGTGLADWVGLVVVFAVAAGLWNLGVEEARAGRSAAFFFVFASVAFVASVLDLRMIVIGGIVGAQRVARHLWRMCTALLIAVTSLFVGQPQVFPQALRDSGLLGVPSLVVLVLLVFWLIRVLATRTYKRTSPPAMVAVEGAVAES